MFLDFLSFHYLKIQISLISVIQSYTFLYQSQHVTIKRPLANRWVVEERKKKPHHPQVVVVDMEEVCQKSLFHNYLLLGGYKKQEIDLSDIMGPPKAASIPPGYPPKPNVPAAFPGGSKNQKFFLCYFSNIL